MTRNVLFKPELSEFSLDAYDHLSYVVGWSDECREDLNEMEILALASNGDLCDEEIEQLVAEATMEDRGDWLACVDFDRRDNYVAYHVVVNSDSAGYIETIEKGCYTLEEARVQLPGLLERMDDTGSEMLVNDGQWYTRSERKENLAAIERWKKALKKALK